MLFTVELIELQKKPLVKLPNSQLWFYLGIAGIIGLLGYELYKRVTNKEEDKEKNTPSKRKGNKKKK